MRPGYLLLVSAASLALACGKPKPATAPIPHVRLSFSALTKLKEDKLGVPYIKKDSRDYAFVWVFGIKGPLPELPPVDFKPLLDYRVKREDLAFYTKDTNYSLTFWRKKEFADWPIGVMPRVGSKVFEAQRAEPYRNDYAYYQTLDAPKEDLKATPIKDTDIRYVVLKSPGAQDHEPKISVTPTFAVWECVSDGNYHWAGTIIGFTPDMKDPQIKVDGLPAKLTGEHVQVVTVYPKE